MVKVDRAQFQSCHQDKFGGQPLDLPPFDDCQGESQPVFGDFKRGLLVNDFGRMYTTGDFLQCQKLYAHYC